MSIATLKKKTGYLYHSQSVGHAHFSLNGTRRPQGYVGQTMLSRSLPRSLAVGNTLRGHGGNNGQYYSGVKNNSGGKGILSGLVDYNEPNVIKPSVVGTNGMLEQRFMWVRRPYPFSSTKPNSYLNTNTQGDHVVSVQNASISKTNCINGEDFVKNVPAKTCKTLPRQYIAPGYNNIDTIKNECNITTPINNIGGVDKINSEGLYLISLNKTCSNLDRTYNLRFPSSTQRGPLPGN